MLARIDDVFPLLGPQGGGERRIIAVITDPLTLRAIRAHRDEPTAPPRVAPPRGPPLWSAVDAARSDSTPPGESSAQPEPAYQFDQRIAW